MAMTPRQRHHARRWQRRRAVLRDVLLMVLVGVLGAAMAFCIGAEMALR